MEILVSFLTIALASATFVIDSSPTSTTRRPTPNQYDTLRQTFLMEQFNRSLGAGITLSPLEQKANDVIMRYKQNELDEGFLNPEDFAPTHHIFEVLGKINSSKVFQLIRHMPKGGVLHAHDTALLSTDKLIKFTYLPHLWMAGDIRSTEVPKFIFSDKPPTDGNSWVLVADVRKNDKNFDEHLRKLFSLYTPDPFHDYRDINVVWKKFQSLFGAIGPIVTYDVVWRKYYYQALKEFLEDGVFYLEFRGVLPMVYALNGTKYSPEQVVELYVNVLEKFMEKYGQVFIGSKFIYAPNRHVGEGQLKEYLKILLRLRKKYPNFVVGFDLVGQEDRGQPLKEFAHDLLTLPSDINFFFHSGETNWNGMSTDENLIDAILLGSKRIGHGFAATRNPKVLEEIKARDICIEVNPISNQVLKLVDDVRNHPATELFADNYPVVISSDDPSFWDTTPLSHDFYFAFLGIASAHSDLRLLKQLVLNSISYSSLNASEKEVAHAKWGIAWERWLQWVVEQ